MTDVSVKYPAALTKTGWDRNKSAMAKLAVGKTDVGAHLLALETQFNRSTYASATTYDGVDAVDFTQHKTALAHGFAADKAGIVGKIGAAKVVVKAAHADFAASKTVSKSVTAYAKTVLDTLDSFKTTLDNYPDLLTKALDQHYHANLKKNIGYVALSDTMKSVPTLAVKIVTLIKGVEAEPTVAKLHATFGHDGPHRMLTTCFKTWDQLMKKHFPRTVAGIYTGTAMSDYFTLKHLADVANEANSVASDPLRLRVQNGEDETKVVKGFLLEYSRSVVEAQKMLKHFTELGKQLEAA
jgi:hypothetical protein